MTKFKVGELIKRKTIINRPKGYCVVVDKVGDNYILYNNSLKCIQQVAIPVINGLYISVVDDGSQLFVSLCSCMIVNVLYCDRRCV